MFHKPEAQQLERISPSLETGGNTNGGLEHFQGKHQRILLVQALVWLSLHRAVTPPCLGQHSASDPNHHSFKHIPQPAAGGAWAALVRCAAHFNPYLSQC